MRCSTQNKLPFVVNNRGKSAHASGTIVALEFLILLSCQMRRTQTRHLVLFMDRVNAPAVLISLDSPCLFMFKVDRLVELQL